MREFLPVWGPYSKKYLGLSRVIESLRGVGARFDFTVHPTLWNSAFPVPNATFPSGCHLWRCAPDYGFFELRYELLWKDEVYADVSFSRIGENTTLVRAAFTNNTDLMQHAVLNFFSSLEFPFPAEVTVDLPDGGRLIGAERYADCAYAKPRPWDTEVPDGNFRGCFRDGEFLDGTGFGDRVDHAHVKFYGFRPFGCEAGDRVRYDFTAACDDPVLVLRYRTVTDGDARFLLNGQSVTLPHSDDLTLCELPYAADPDFVSEGGAGVEFDFLAAVPRGTCVTVGKRDFATVPEVRVTPKGRGVETALAYPYDGCRFYLLTHRGDTRRRVLDSGCLEDALPNRLSNGDVTFDQLAETFSRSFRNKHSDPGHYDVTLLPTVELPPHATRVEYAVISETPFDPLTDDEYETLYEKAAATADAQTLNAAGAPFAFSSGLLRTTLLMNAVYPVYRHGENVIHHTPGKRWDSFYTWDSGIIGLGLLEIAPALCRRNLELYLAEAEDKDFAFVLHGSLVPTQFAAYHELLKRAQNKRDYDDLYPKMKRYYEFLQGREGSSSFDRLGCGLLTAYDYWYSCSGMDDYPAQSEMIRRGAEEFSAPCLTTAQVVRCAKIMKQIAVFLGKADDAAEYDADIARGAAALNTLAWDKESGYYGYVLTDGEPRLMRTADGENFDKGFDGLYPLVAGVAPPERRRRLLEHLKNPDEIWTQAGLSAVDRTASYARDDGYWNGNVWMSHQWYFWKTLLDLGEADFAFAVADRALRVWKQETDFSYNTYECFGIRTLRGGWFHNFGGLSAPIAVWTAAYAKPGTVTTGFDVWTDRQAATDESAEVVFRYEGDSPRYNILVTLSDKRRYAATLDGRPLDFTEQVPGSLTFTLDGAVKQGTLTVHAV